MEFDFNFRIKNIELRKLKPSLNNDDVYFFEVVKWIKTSEEKENCIALCWIGYNKDVRKVNSIEDIDVCTVSSRPFELSSEDFEIFKNVINSFYDALYKYLKMKENFNG